MIWGGPKKPVAPGTWELIFALVPHKLDDGRWIWLELVWRARLINHDDPYYVYSITANIWENAHG